MKGKRRRHEAFKWTAPVVEDLYSLYGIYGAKAIARRLNAKHGTDFTAGAVKWYANTHEGLTRASAQPYMFLADAARLLGIDYGRLNRHCHRAGHHLIGNGVTGRYLLDETWAQLQEDFKQPPEPAIGIPEAARRLHYTPAAIGMMVTRGKLRSYRFGGRRLVSLEQVERLERDARGIRLIGDTERKPA